MSQYEGTIQMRRGLLSDLDKSKLVAGEFAVTTNEDSSKQQAYLCFGAKNVKRLAMADDVNQRIDDVIMSRFTVEPVYNSYVDKSGNIKFYSGWSRTDYINISEYVDLLIQTDVASEYNVFYDSNKKFVKSFKLDSGNNNIVIPENACYMILSNTDAGLASVEISGVNRKIVKNYEDLKEYSLTSRNDTVGNLINPDDITDNCYIDKGQIITYSGWKLTGYIPVKPGQIYKFVYFNNYGMKVDIGFYYAAWYDCNKNYIGYSIAKQNLPPVFFDDVIVPKNAAYIRISTDSKWLNNTDNVYTVFGQRDYVEKLRTPIAFGNNIPFVERINYDFFYESFESVKMTGKIQLKPHWIGGGLNSDNGYECENTHYIHSELCPVPVGKKIRFNVNSNLYDSDIPLPNIFYYDSEFKYKGSLYTGGSQGASSPRDISVIAQYPYVRFALGRKDEGWDVAPSGVDKATSTHCDIGDNSTIYVYIDDYSAIYEELVDSAIADFNKKSDASRVGYIWLSDLHAKTSYGEEHQKCLKRQIQAAVDIANNTSVDFICFGGDLIDAEPDVDNIYSLLSKILTPLEACRKPVLYVTGNHDDNCYQTLITKSVLKGLTQARGCNMAVYPDSDACYYYVDFPNKFTRVICMDSIDYAKDYAEGAKSYWSLSEKQVRWLAETALNTDYRILIMNHQCMDYRYNYYGHGNEGGYSQDAIDIICAYNNRVSVQLDYATYDFSQAKGKVILQHSGHLHFDKEVIYNDTIPCIITACAKQYDESEGNLKGLTAVEGEEDTYIVSNTDGHNNSTGWTLRYYRERVLKTKNEALFDVVSVNKNLITCIRVGAGSDRILSIN